MAHAGIGVFADCRTWFVWGGRAGGGNGGRSGPFLGELSLDEAGRGYAGAAFHGAGRKDARRHTFLPSVYLEIPGPLRCC